MKYLFTLILLLILTSTTIQNPPIQLLQINAEWNTRNDIKLKLPKDYKGYRISIDYILYHYIVYHSTALYTIAL